MNPNPALWSVRGVVYRVSAPGALGDNDDLLTLVVRPATLLHGTPAVDQRIVLSAHEDVAAPVDERVQP